jgi:hypothetical protein
MQDHFQSVSILTRLLPETEVHFPFSLYYRKEIGFWSQQALYSMGIQCLFPREQSVQGLRLIIRHRDIYTVTFTHWQHLLTYIYSKIKLYLPSLSVDLTY